MTKEELEELDLMSEIQFQEWLNVADNFYRYEKYTVEQNKIIGKKITDYAEKYIGSGFYNDAIACIEYGYNLAMEDE